MASTPPVERYVLEGRLVTMGPEGIIDDGAIFVDDDVIEFVQPVSAPLPDTKYAGVPRIRTGDTIYPGLIELHNHLSYNAMPLWNVRDKYTNNGKWRGTEPYTREITKPTQVLGQTPRAAKALVRYVECRALLGGVTTSQGITLFSAKSIEKYYKGLIRNVEAPLRPDLPRAGSKIANPPTNGAEDYLAKNLKKNTCYLQHLSEGTDATARGWFLRLRIDDSNWAINEVLCAIHCAALERGDFDILASHKASMVWSPLSNYLLYGETARIADAKAAGMSISLGSDWAPSGSKNLLGELKVAWLASKHHGDVFTPEELVAMVTINPARANKWDHLLGSIEPGKLADLVAINGRSDDAHEQLLLARETSVTLVTIGGVPRVGQKNLMKRFWPDDDLEQMQEIERYNIERSSRYLYLSHDDDLLDGLLLSQAIDDLTDAMANLPQLAADVDNGVGSAITASGSVAFSAGIADGDGEVWRVAPDFEGDDLERAYGAARASQPGLDQGDTSLVNAAAADAGVVLGAEPYAFWVTAPMALDPITVVEDANHLRTLVRAPNLPDHIRHGLPELYGENIAIPESVGFLETTAETVADELKTSAGDLRTVLAFNGELTLDDRKRIVDEALLVLQENYVHLPLKRAMYAVDPLQRLRLLRHRLDDMESDTMPREIEFHGEVTEIFNSLRDLHTGYRLPRPFSSRVAWLPFLIEEIETRGRTGYILTKWVAQAWPDPAMEGANVTHWNGMAIERAVARNADQQAGSNPDARHARGINSLTIRPLARSLAPDEEWVVLRWVDGDGASQEFRQEWLVFEPGSPIGPADLLSETCALGFDDITDDVQQAKKTIYAPKIAEAERKSAGQQVRRAIHDGSSDLVSFMPGVFRAKSVRRTNGGSQSQHYGYIRIFTFHVPNADAFVDEFVRLAEQLPLEGLIIDVRGNGGGLIYAAEQLLNVLSPHAIEPERAHFINTPLNLSICGRHAPSARFADLDLSSWKESMGQALRTGATYSLGFPITPDTVVSRLGQRYYGPKVLITDPLCYSATDMFAAGFQDHGLGKIIGVGGATGAGGANVWTHALLRRLTEPDTEHPEPSPYSPLPNGADMRVAMRRTTRVKGNSGAVLEDLGVEPDIVHRMTRRDVTDHNKDLMDRAIKVLSSERPHTIDVRHIQGHRDRAPTMRIRTQNVDRVETTAGGRSLQSRLIRADGAKLELGEVVRADATGEIIVHMLGYVGSKLVAEMRMPLDLG